MKGIFTTIILLSIFSVVCFSKSDSTIVLSEIMFYPQSGNNEFIEIYNTSSQDSINLANYKIIYQNSDSDTIQSTGYGTVLPPQTFGIIFQNDYDITNGIYRNLIPTNALQLKISDDYFGSRGMSNSADRTIYLLNSSNDTLQSYTYTADNSEGISDEKIILDADNSNLNWSNSKIMNGTPGGWNSVSLYDYDLEVSSFTYSPDLPIQNEALTIKASIKNIGQKNVNGFTLNIYNDLNKDSTGSNNEIIYAQNEISLNSNDSITITKILQNLDAGKYNLLAEINFDKDQRTSNNKKFLSLTINRKFYNYNDVIINEIMYAPQSPEPEWVELFNRADSSVNLKNWTVTDGNTKTKIYDNNFYISSKSYIVLSKDSSISDYYDIPSPVIVLNLPTLNNGGDKLVIEDSLGIIIDSVNYKPEWGDKDGISLERISPDDSSNNPLNWGSSKVKGTPGKINSLTKKNYDIEISSLIFTPKFPLLGSDVNVYAEIKNSGYKKADFNLKFFVDSNNDSLPDNILSTTKTYSLQPNDSMLISSPNEIKNITNKKTITAKAYFSEDQDTTNNYLLKSISPGVAPKTVVINEIMYNPAGGEPEWIELYNTSNDSINLENWEINDVLTTPSIAKINRENFILPKSYMVVSRDSSLLNFHRLITSNIIVTNLPTLNNDEDGVVLKDDRGITIDSVFYQQSWGGIKGFSLERKSYTVSSNLSTNWGNSIDIENSTPGRINSITPKTYDLIISNISSIPEFPVKGDSIFLSATIKNLGSKTADNFEVSFFYDSNQNNKVNKSLGMIMAKNLQSGDSVNINSSLQIPNLQFNVLTAAKIYFSADEDTLNNYLEKIIEPGFSQKSLLINEIMYAPENGEPEWIELINSSNKTLNLKNWFIEDVQPSRQTNFITNQDYFLQPDELLVLTKDSSFFNFHPSVKSKVLVLNFGTLGNTSDGIRIYDFRNALIDDLNYNSNWGGKHGFSLERISTEKATNDSSNWLTSLSKNKSTPGQPNSILGIPNYNRNALVINEIMFDPKEGNSEFVEFLNISSSDINIGGWKIEDKKGNVYKLSETSLNLAPNNYFVLAADSDIISNYHINNFNNLNVTNTNSLNLDNSGQLIILKDLRNNTIDSVFYSKNWHNKNFTNTKNISLERIDPFMDGNDSNNWSSSASESGATPGQQNSIYTINTNQHSEISISPNPFSPDNDGYQDFTKINYRLNQKISQIRIKIFDSQGRLVRTLVNNSESGDKGSVIFDGRDNKGNPLRIGIYIVYLQALNINSGFEKDLKTVVVVARKL
jgi:Lamin Tail Domain/CHU_C Type IX secretion signal domain/CARDB